MKCTQTFVNGPLMSVLSKDGGLTFVHVTQRTVIPISLQEVDILSNQRICLVTLSMSERKSLGSTMHDVTQFVLCTISRNVTSGNERNF